MKDFFYEFIKEVYSDDNFFHQLRTYIIHKGYYFEIITKVGNVKTMDLHIKIITEERFNNIASQNNFSFENNIELNLKDKFYYKDMVKLIREEKLKEILK